MKSFLESKMSWKTVFFTTILFTFFIMMVLPNVSKYAENNIGGSGSPDTEILISGEQLYEIADSYGEEGRDTYVFLRWTFDIIWPLVYMIFLLSLIVVLSKNIKYKWIQYMYMLPIIAMLFDYLENTFLTIVMIRFPVKMYLFGSITSYVSLAKWSVLSSSFIVVIIIGIVRIVKWKDLKGV